MLLVSRLIEKYDNTLENQEKNLKDKIEEICLYIQNHFTEHISLDELCRLYDISKSTLLRDFTKYKGLTPYKYLQSVRIAKAKKLLRKGNTIAETSAEIGFVDQSHFTKFFIMFIGVSPAAYQNIFKNNK